MGAAVATIPFEKQPDSQNNRACGAAALSMVYRSLGKEVAQAEIWPAIAKENRFGSIASTTYLMAKDALNRGFSVLAFQARHPLMSLRLCRELGIRAVLNQRLRPDAPTGHYTVLVDVDEKRIVLHDPFYGPSRQVSHAELLELWQPHFSNSEIVGYMLIAVGLRSSELHTCHLCHTATPPSIECPKCKQPVSLQPGAILGCVNAACIARAWNYICCPSCDYTWTFSLEQKTAAAAPTDSAVPGNAASLGNMEALKAQAAVAAEDPASLSRVFREVDKFMAYVAGLPEAANNPLIKKHLEVMAATKEKASLALAEQMAYQQARMQQLDELKQLAAQREQAHQKKVEELNRPSPPLDGNALGRALLKNLGFPTK